MLLFTAQAVSTNVNSPFLSRDNREPITTRHFVHVAVSVWLCYSRLRFPVLDFRRAGVSSHVTNTWWILVPDWWRGSSARLLIGRLLSRDMMVHLLQVFTPPPICHVFLFFLRASILLFFLLIYFKTRNKHFCHVLQHWWRLPLR